MDYVWICLFLSLPCRGSCLALLLGKLCVSIIVPDNCRTAYCMCELMHPMQVSRRGEVVLEGGDSLVVLAHS